MRRVAMFLVVAAALAAGSVQAADSAKPEFLNTKESLARGLPFSEAVRAGDLLFLSGQIGDKDGKVVPGGIVPEARQALQEVEDPKLPKRLDPYDPADLIGWASAHRGDASDEKDGGPRPTVARST